MWSRAVWCHDALSQLESDVSRAAFRGGFSLYLACANKVFRVAEAGGGVLDLR